jgi:DNA-binding CsgD family transcriptional regulator
MQTILPLYPVNTEFINPSLGVCQKDGIITYISNAMPIQSHAKDDYKSFRYFTAKLVLLGRCSQKEIADCFHVSYDSVKRSVRRLRETGDSGFYTEDNRHGNAYKLIPSVLEKIQRAIDAGKRNTEIARMLNISEGSVRYAVKKGLVKKNSHPNSPL